MRELLENYTLSDGTSLDVFVDCIIAAIQRNPDNTYKIIDDFLEVIILEDIQDMSVLHAAAYTMQSNAGLNKFMFWKLKKFDEFNEKYRARLEAYKAQLRENV